MDQVADAVAEHLHLDVPRVHEQLLDIERGVAERGSGLHCRLADHVGQLARVSGDADPSAPAAGRRLDHHRVADGRGDLERVLERRGSFRSRDGRHARPLREPPRLGLVAHRSDRFGRRADEDEARVLAGSGEGGVLGEEAVAGMDGVRARLRAAWSRAVDVEVAVARVRRPDADRLVGQPDVERLLVGGRVDGDGAEAELAAGADHPDGDLAAVGDEDLHAARPLSLRGR